MCVCVDNVDDDSARNMFSINNFALVCRIHSMITYDKWQMAGDTKHTRKMTQKSRSINLSSYQMCHNNRSTTIISAYFMANKCRLFYPAKCIRFGMFWTSLIILFCYWLSLYAWAKKKNLHKNAITLPQPWCTSHPYNVWHTPDIDTVFLCV